MPSTRTEFWKKKLEGNRNRDKLNKQLLKKMSWRVISIYECSWRLSKKNIEVQLDIITSKVIDFIKNGRQQTMTIQSSDRTNKNE